MSYYNDSTRVMCVIDEKGNIFSTDMTGNTHQAIGVVNEQYKKMVSVATEGADAVESLTKEIEKIKEERDKYFNILVEHKLIQKPLTQEEINQELIRQNNLMAKQLESMAAILEGLKTKEVLENEHREDTWTGVEIRGGQEQDDAGDKGIGEIPENDRGADGSNQEPRGDKISGVSIESNTVSTSPSRIKNGRGGRKQAR